MKTLIVPCAGKSSRFPNMKPKYLLTYPDGKLMVEKAIEGLDLDVFDRVIITIVREHDEMYDSLTILNQIFGKDHKYEILVLDEFTKSQSETVALTIEKLNVKGEIWIKDSDNYVKANISKANAIVGLNIETYRHEVNRLAAKSFLIVNEQGNVVDIIEKKIKSQYICIGVYGFEDADLFLSAYKILSKESNIGEIYVSHIISYLIGRKMSVFSYIEAEEYEDWGTLDDWKIVQNKHAIYIVNFDGVLILKRSRYGSLNWNSEFIAIDENIECLKSLSDNGAQIIVTSTRGDDQRKRIIDWLTVRGIKVHQLLLNCYYAPQIVINDFSASNQYPSCNAVNIPRNGKLGEYI
jgi:hypothetical protein